MNYSRYLQPANWPDAPLEVPAEIRAGHKLFRVVDGDNTDAFFTGYYEPTLRASPIKTGVYRYPIYKTPANPTQFSRKEIMAGALENQKLELFYTDDPVDLFFMHIQGSGRLQLPDGAFARVKFAAKNERAYTAIGRVLKDEGSLASPITMQSIRDYLAAHPERIAEILARNESYIFFAPNPEAGPVGASGAVLQPEASLAIDDAIWPYGLHFIVDCPHPVTGQPFQRLVTSADKGSAIKGPLRGDIFFGASENAAQLAGAMQAKGKLWVLLKD